MNTKLAIVGMATALFVGAGLSMAVAAEPGPDTTAAPANVADAMSDMHTAMGTAEMDRMHAAMRDDMPAELREQCDEMHAAMAGPGMGGAGPEAGAMHHRHHGEQSS